MNRINSLYQSPINIKNYKYNTNSNIGPTFKGTQKLADITIDTAVKNKQTLLKGAATLCSE